MGADEWTPYRLGELVDIEHGFAFEGGFFRDEPTGDILLTPGNFSVGGGFKRGKLNYYAGPVPDEFVLGEGDLLVTMTDLSKNADTLGYPAVLPKEQGGRYLHNQRLGKVVVKPNAPVTKRFLYYVLCTREYRHEILASASGSTVRHTSPNRIAAFTFCLPPIPEQRAIARILGSLDDKIELNRRMNETLEQISQAIFKSWFVDFLPVRAKMAAKAQVQSAMLPAPKRDRWFVYAIQCEDDSVYIGQTEDLRQRWEEHREGRASRWTKRHEPLRVVYWEYAESREQAVEREKWLKTGFGRKWLRREIARTQTGEPVKAKAAGRQPVGMDAATAALLPDSFEESEIGDVPWGWAVAPLDQVAGFLNGLALQKYPPDDGDSLPVIKIAELRNGVTKSSDRASGVPGPYIVDDGDILFSWSGSLEVVIWCGGKGALNQHLFKVTSDRYPKWFCYFWVRQHLPEFRAIASDKATTMGHIRRHHLSEAQVPVPPQSLTAAADRIISPLFSRIVVNCQESRTLAAIRDALLPKLMSGEVRVGEAERVAGGAA